MMKSARGNIPSFNFPSYNHVGQIPRIKIATTQTRGKLRHKLSSERGHNMFEDSISKDEEQLITEWVDKNY